MKLQKSFYTLPDDTFQFLLLFHYKNPILLTFIHANYRRKLYIFERQFIRAIKVDRRREEEISANAGFSRFYESGSVDFIYDSDTDHDLYLTNERFHHTNSRNPICLFISFNGPKITFY